MQTFIFLAVAILAEVAATTALRASQGFTQVVPSVIVVVGYGTAFFFLSLTLRDMPIGIAYAIWSGLGIVLISVLAWAIYGQKLDGPALLGMAFIVAGVLIINLLSDSTTH